MKIQTIRFGELDISEEEILTFPEGLLGFGDHKRYVLICNDSIEPLRWLQCVDDPNLAFVVLDPRSVIEDYDIKLSRECVSGLQLESPEDVAIFGIVTADPDPHKCTINLQAPIIVNVRNHCARQVILLDQQYCIRHPLVSACQQESMNQRSAF